MTLSASPQAIVFHGQRGLGRLLLGRAAVSVLVHSTVPALTTDRHTCVKSFPSNSEKRSQLNLRKASQTCRITTCRLI